MTCPLCRTDRAILRQKLRTALERWQAEVEDILRDVCGDPDCAGYSFDCEDSDFYRGTGHRTVMSTGKTYSVEEIEPHKYVYREVK